MASSAARVKGLALVLVAYVAAGIVGGLVWLWLRDRSLIVAVAAADVAATVVTFAFSLAANNSSVYDVYWSVAPMAIAAGLFGAGLHDGAPQARRWIVLALVFLWGLRLTGHWVRSWTGLSQEDWRYVDMRRTTGKGYWVASFFGLHLVPTIITFLGGLAMFPVFARPARELNVVDALAGVVMLGAVTLETVADEQLRTFRASNPPSGTIMDRGLWSVCRHPNYVGEMTFWWGLWLFGVAAGGAWWIVLGPLSITGLIAGVSVRMIDKRSLERRPGYAEHMKKLNAFLPRL